jgi:ABC-type proline/glycine betaine transport system substrate-binding protein
MKRLIRSCVLALSGTAFLSASVMAAEPPSCQNVRMGVVNWTDVIATSAMTQVLLDGLGYRPNRPAPPSRSSSPASATSAWTCSSATGTR